MDAYIGLIAIFAGNFAPYGWALCQGQLLSINQYQAVFAILGTQYGGNGQTDFGLPNLSGRVPIGFGQGAGLANNYAIGAKGGVENVTLTVANLAAHTHTVAAASGSIAMQAGNSGGNTTDPNGNYLVNAGDGLSTTYNNFAPQAAAGTLSNLAGTSINLSGLTLNPAGSSTPVVALPPYQAVNYIICLQGIFPSRG